MSSVQSKLAFAKQMRRSPSWNERSLWKLLRDRKLDGLKFRRQVPIGRYIADFVCFQRRLIVEADGPHHEDSLHDLERDAWLAAQGFRVVRIPNSEIEMQPDKVLTTVVEAARAPLLKMPG